MNALVTTDAAELEPCRIDVSRGGGWWHPVAEFQVGCSEAELAAKRGVEALASLDEAAVFRLVDVRRNRTVLSHTRRGGWTVHADALRDGGPDGG